MTDEADLIARSIGGDLEAYDQLVGAYQDRLYQVAYRLTGNHEDACDAAQDALVNAFRFLPRFRRAAAFSTWLYRITVNAALDLVRRRPAHSTVSLETVAVSGGSEPADVVARADLQRRIHEAIAGLPIDQRVVVVLRDLQGLAYEDIASALRIPVGTVRSRLSRGREALRSQLADLAPAGGL